MSLRLWGVGAAVFALCTIATPAQATVMVEVPLEDMIRDADAIVIGVVERSGTRLRMTGGELEPHTITTIAVSDWLKSPGAEPPGRVTIRERGGEWQDGGRWIAGTPLYRAGEEVLLFLRKDVEMAGAFRTYGMVQGKFTVRRGVMDVPTTVIRDLETISFARWTDGQMAVEHARDAGPMQLDNLRQLVSQILSLGRVR